MFLLLLLSVFSMWSQAQLLIIYLVVISYQKLINIFVKQTNKTKECSFKKDFTSLWSAFSQCGAGQSCSSVISLLLISHFKHKDNRFYLLCFHHYCVDRGTSLFDVSQCHICFCFFLFVFDDPVTSNRHKKIFVYMISAVQNY